MTKDARAELPMAELVELARILEEIVVSVHRITSRLEGEFDVPSALEQYFSTYDVLRRLAQARRIVHTAMDQVLTEEQAQAVLAGIEYWAEDRGAGPSRP